MYNQRRPSRAAAVFIDNNAQAHRVSQVDVVTVVRIRCLDWPGQSPIEHPWDILKLRIRSQHPAPQNIRELKTVITPNFNVFPKKS